MAIYLPKVPRARVINYCDNPDLMYYKDTAYDITSDIIKGLNSEYKPKN